MKKQTLLFVSLALSLNGIAQKAPPKYDTEAAKLCDGLNSALSKEGRWSKTDNDIVFPDKTFPSAQYKLIARRADSIFLLVREGLQHLHGVEARNQYGMRGDAYIPNGPVPFYSDTYFLEYYCNTNLRKILLDDETFNKISIFVNRLNYFWEKADEWDINGDGKIKSIYQLPVRIGKWNGLHIFELKTNSISYTAKAVIIGRQDKVPWRGLTRKQYLIGLKNKWENNLRKVAPGTSSEKDYKQKLKHVNDYLTSATEEDLQEQVIIDPRAGIWGFKGKFGQEENNGFRLVLPALSDKYFDRNLPRDFPQLIELYWAYGHSRVARELIEEFEKNFPLKKLEAMIDK
jgi:hypothetical protein